MMGRWFAVWLAAVACTPTSDDADDPVGTDADTATEVDTEADTEADTEFDGVMTDVDGNTYTTVRIGEQVWMAENLAVQSFNDGTPIPEWSFEEEVDWYSINSPQPWFQWASTDDLGNIYDEPLPHDFYGALYNEAVLSSGRLAPEGWRLPTIDDFVELEQTLIADGRDVSSLRSRFGWVLPEDNGTDDYGFNVLPSGYASAFGSATAAGAVVTWATSDMGETPNTRMGVTLTGEPTLFMGENTVFLGPGVRLIRE